MRWLEDWAQAGVLGHLGFFLPWVVPHGLSTKVAHAAVRTPKEEPSKRKKSKTAGPLKCYSLTLSLPLLLTWLVLEATGLRTIKGMNTRRQGSLGTVFWVLFPISLPFAWGAKIVFFIFVIPVPCMNLTPSGHSLRPLNETVEVKLQNWETGQVKKSQSQGKIGGGTEMPSILYLS